MEVRVRYAPSPTGLQHIGGVRTALYNYFFARANKGKFILRIEDTDRERYSKESEKDLFDTLEWLGIKWDEGPIVGGKYGPYIQSERTELYKKWAEELVKKDKAYYCFCSPSRLEKIRKEQEKSKSSQVGYDRHCRNIPIEEAKKRIANGDEYVIRLKVPLEGSTSFDDLILGHIERENRDINPDPVLLKKDGFPTYHLANVIDDHLMGITHIMRAQEWVPSTPLHIIMYKAFGWDIPKYCHLPMVMGSDGKKLSKRHGSTSAKEFREKGYLKESITNYVTLVGWALDGQRELFSKTDLEKLFKIEGIHKNPGVFDYKKLDWFNGYYIREKSDKDLSELLFPYFKSNKSIKGSKDLLPFVPLIKERLKTLSEAPEMISFLLNDKLTYPNKEEFIPKGKSLKEAISSLEESTKRIKELLAKSKSFKEIESTLCEDAKTKGEKLNNVFSPIRVAITGAKVSPPLFESMEILGEKKCLERLQTAIDYLKKG